MSIVLLIMAFAATFLSGMHASAIMINRSENLPVKLWQYVYVFILAVFGVYYMIALLGHTS